jgi:hypothetical protein
MSENTNKRSGGPKHIKEILKEAKKEWLKNRAEAYMVSPEFKETFDSCKHIQIMFIYIDGDPQYIRTIYLN